MRQALIIDNSRSIHAQATARVDDGARFQGENAMQKTVMIVDDSIPIHVLVKSHLESERLRFHSFYDGVNAHVAAVSLQPDLILLDVDMPRSDGFEICRDLKTDPLTSSIPLIFLSGDSLLSDKVKGLDLGAFGYIVKPFKTEELRTRVRCALGNNSESKLDFAVDGIRGLWNSSHFNQLLDSKLSHSMKTSRPVTCVVAVPHVSGPLKLKPDYQAAHTLSKQIARTFVFRNRPEDSLFKFDNGKLVLLLSDTSQQQAAKVLELLQEDLKSFSIPNKAGLSASFSFGLSDTLITSGSSLLEQAEHSIEQSMQLGGNPVNITPPMSDRFHLVA